MEKKSGCKHDQTCLELLRQTFNGILCQQFNIDETSFNSIYKKIYMIYIPQSHINMAASVDDSLNSPLENVLISQKNNKLKQEKVLNEKVSS